MNIKYLTSNKESIPHRNLRNLNNHTEIKTIHNFIWNKKPDHKILYVVLVFPLFETFHNKVDLATVTNTSIHPIHTM